MTNRSYRGLTLIELIATMVAIGVVLAVLVPSLAETRRRGKDVVCIQNLHRIAQATAIYSGRESGEPALPVWIGAFSDISQYPQIPAFAYGGKSGLGGGITLSIQTSTYGPAFKANSHFRPLNRVLFRGPIGNVASRPGGRTGFRWLPDSRLDMKVYQCPSDSGYTGLYALDEWKNSGLSSYDHFGTSYATNVLWIPFLIQTFDLRSISPFLRSISQVPVPTRTIGYIENCGRYAWRASPDPFFPSDSLLGTAGGWHGSDWTFNAAFMDGRVAPIMMRGFRSEPLARLPEPQDVGAWAAWTIRGEGWQLDTLPADPVRTDIPALMGFGRVP